MGRKKPQPWGSICYVSQKAVDDGLPIIGEMEMALLAPSFALDRRNYCSHLGTEPVDGTYLFVPQPCNFVKNIYIF